MSVDEMKNRKVLGLVSAVVEEPVASDEQLALCREFQREVTVKLREVVRGNPDLAETFYCGRPKSKAAKAKPARLSFMARHIFTPGKTGVGNAHCRPNEMIIEARVPDLERREDGGFAVREEDLIYIRHLIGLGLIGKIINDPSLAFQVDFFRDMSRASIGNVVCGGRPEDIAETVARGAYMTLGCINGLKRERVFDY